MNNITDASSAVQALLSKLRQTHRLLRLSFPHDDAPDDVLLANRLGATEALSRDFVFLVEVLSTNAKIELKDMQGKLVTVSLVRGDGTLRHFNGYCFEFRLVRTDGGFAFYDMVLLPWLAYLRLRRDNYLFHDKTVLEQTESIFADYDVRDWQTDIQGEIPPVTDACQYDESDYNYLHRRWEALGWHYRYEHREDGHTLVLSDSTYRAEPIDGLDPTVPWQDNTGSLDEDGIHHWTPVRRIVPTQYAVSSFDFKNPRPQQMEVPTLNQQGDVLGQEIYEYQGAYGFKTSADADRIARLRMEEIEAGGKHFEAMGNNRCMQAGRWFTLSGHFDAPELGSNEEDQGKFLVLDVRHEATNNYQHKSQVPARYENRITCIRKAVPWRPGRGLNSKEPRIYGLQTAIVVGPAGEEIWTDEYGRVKVQFHWDRVGEYDERSSAWIRVATGWAGSNFGFVSLPRVGQEVVVQFLDGNPDRPLITGSVFNEHNQPPWNLPANKTQTGFLSRSTKGGPENANAIRFEDKRGGEELWIHAEKDQRIEVENCESHSVGADRSKTVGGNETTRIAKDRQQDVGGSHTEVVKNDITVASSEGDIVITSLKGSIVLKAEQTIVFEVGQSRVVMNQDGTILVTGPTRIDLNE